MPEETTQQQPAQQPQNPQPANPEPAKKPFVVSDEVKAKFLGFAARLDAKKEEKPKEEAAAPQDPPKESAETKPAEPKAGDPKPADGDPAPKKKQTAPKVMKAPPQQDPNVIAEAAAKAAVAAVEASKKKEAEPKPVEVELPKKVARNLDYYKEMETLDPKYKDITKKVVEFSKKGGLEEQYIAKWEEANPGQKFDEDAEEHNAFYAKHAPDYDEDDLEIAKEQVIERRAVEKAKQSLQPELKKQERRQAEEAAEEDFNAITAEIATEVISAINKDLLKVATEKGDAGLLEEDPLAMQVAEEVLPRHEAVAHEAIKLFRGIATPSDRNPVHSRINNIAIDLNEAISNIVSQDQNAGLKPVLRGTRVVGYQMFAPLEQYASMTPEQKKAHWTIGEAEVVAHIRSVAGREAKSRYDQIMAAAQKTVGAKTRQAAPSTQAKPEAQKPTETTPAIKSPTVGASNQTPTPNAGQSGVASGKGGSFAKAWAGV